MTEPTSDWGRGAWMQTFTGRRFFPLDPRAGDVDPTDIAHALSLICRYGGHVTRFYSVAEHCFLMSHAVSPENALAALLHDATEAYVGDMVRPLKHHMPEYQAVEAKVWDAVTLRFGLRALNQETPALPVEVKAADNRILIDERAALLTPTEDRWAQDDLEALGVRVEGWPPVVAELRYRARLQELANLDSFEWLGMNR